MRVKKYMFNKKYIIIAVLVALILVFSMNFLFFSKQSNPGKEEIIAIINGEPLYMGELQQQIQLERSAVVQYFYEKHKAKFSNNFWNTNYNGEIPGEVIKEKALAACVDIKIQQILTKEHGIQQDISYINFLREWKSENARRLSAVENNEVIYGPIQYEESIFFDDIFSKAIIQLKEVLAIKKFTFTEQDFQSYYDSIKDEYYKKEDLIRINKISSCFVDTDGNIDANKRQDYYYQMQQLKTKLIAGEPLQQLVTFYSDTAVFKMQTFGGDNQVKANAIEYKLKQESYLLTVNEVSDIFEMNNTFFIIQPVERSFNGYETYFDVQENVQSKYIDVQYDKLIERLVLEAEVIKNNNYFAIKIDDF